MLTSLCTVIGMGLECPGRKIPGNPRDSWDLEQILLRRPRDWDSKILLSNSFETIWDSRPKEFSCPR